MNMRVMNKANILFALSAAFMLAYAFFARAATLSAPTFNVASGGYAEAQIVALTSAEGGTICYTTDGSAPAASAPGTCAAGSTAYDGAITVSSTQTIRAIATLAENTDSAVASATYVIGDFITFTTTGASFAPILTLSAASNVQWVFGDGQTSTVNNPSITFASAATRTHVVQLSDWSVLTRINLGYNGYHGGTGPGTGVNTFASLAGQNVTAVSGLENAAGSLVGWASNANPIASLDFTNFTHLTTVECYQCSALTSISLAGDTALTRLNLEGATGYVGVLDLSGATGLLDLRLASVNPSSIIWPEAGVPNLATLSVHDRALSSLDLSDFPALRNLEAYNDVNLTALDVAGIANLNYLDLHNDVLNATALDDILQKVDGFNTRDGYLNFAVAEGAIPSMAGQTYMNNLMGRGWTVVTNGTFLTLSKAGNGGTGAVTISGDVGSTVCPASASLCKVAAASGTAFTLAMAASEGTTFGGWTGGGCSGTDACSLTLTASTLVSASLTTAATGIRGPITSSYIYDSGVGTALSAPARLHTQGNLIAVLVGAFQSVSNFSVSDTQGNTYVPVGSRFESGGTSVTGQWFYAFARTTSENVVTMSLTTGASNRTIRVLEYAGIDPDDPVDYVGNAAANSSPSFTTQAKQEIVLAGWHAEGAFSCVPNSGYVLTPDNDCWTGGVARPVTQKLLSAAQGGGGASLATPYRKEYWAGVARNWTMTLRGLTTAQPTFSVAGGHYNSTRSVSIADTDSSTICYTTDGSVPAGDGAGGCANGTLYMAPVSISATTVLRAIAWTSAYGDSNVALASYIFGAGIQGPLTHSATSGVSLLYATNITSDPLTHTAGDLIAVFVGGYVPGTPITVADTQGNTYHAAGTQFPVDGSSITGQWFYAFASATGSNVVTATYHNYGAYRSLRVLEYANIDSDNPLDVGPVYNSYANVLSAASTAFTTTSPYELLLAAWHAENVTAVTGGAGWTLLPYPGTGITRPVEHRIVSSVQTNATASLSVAAANRIMRSWVVSFRQAPTPAPTFSVPSGTYGTAQSVTLESAAGGTICYTQDGSTPTADGAGNCTHGSVYASPLSIVSTATVQALSSEAGRPDSAVSSATYTITSGIFGPITHAEVSAQSAGSTSVAAPAATHTAGHLLAVFVNCYGNPGAISVADSQGNNYTAAGTLAAPYNNVYGQWFYAFAKETGSNAVTASFTQAASYRTIRVLEYANIRRDSPVDAYVTGAGATSSAFSTTFANDVILAGFHADRDLATGDPLTACAATGDYTLNPNDYCSTHIGRPVAQLITSETLSGATASLDHTGGAVWSHFVVAFKGEEPVAFAPAAGTYNAAQHVTLSGTLAGAAFCYTTDGSDPTADGAGNCTHGSVYASPISVTSTTTVKALASKAGWGNSAVVSATYTIPPIELVSHTEVKFVVADGTSATAPAVTHTQGNLIAVFLASFRPAVAGGGQDLSVTDTQGNTYAGSATDVIVGDVADPWGYVTGGWFYAFAKTTGSNTVTGHFNGAYYTMRVMEYSGVSSTDPMDVAGVSGKGTTSPAFSTSMPNELVLAAWHTESVTEAAADAGYGFVPDGAASATNGDYVWRPVESRVVTAPLTDATVSLTGTGSIIGAWVASFNAASNETVDTPVISLAAGTYPNAQSVTLTDSTTDAAIHYTTDGTTPSASSALYEGAITIDSTQTLKAIAVKADMLDSAVASATYTIAPEGSITFTTTGATFSPIIKVSGTPTILWTFADGSTSSALHPSVDFGSAATRTAYLTVTPWSALTDINLGYAHDDGGINNESIIATQTQQNVTAIGNLSLAASSLVTFAASRNPITSLDFTGFSALQRMECYNCSALTSIELHGTSALFRLCLENANLTALDLSETPNLADLRGALQGATDTNSFTINWGSIGSAVWHICIRDNYGMTDTAMAFTQFPLLRELFNWGTLQTGTLAPVSTHLTSVQSAYNYYTGANLADLFAAGRPEGNGSVNLSHNNLTSIDITDDPGLTHLDLHHNSLNQAAVDGILATLDSFGTSNFYVNLTENSAPSAADGVEHAANLVARGWTVLTATPTLDAPTFSPDAEAYAAAQSVSLSVAVPGATICYTTDGSAPATAGAGICAGGATQTYAGALDIASSTTIRALATMSGANDSAEANAIYAISAIQGPVTHAATDSNAAAGTSVSAPAVTHTQGNLIAVFLAAFDNAGALEVSDTQGNAYTAVGAATMLTPYEGYPAVTGQWFYAIAKATGSNTVTGSYNGSHSTIRVLEYAGIDHHSPLDFHTSGYLSDLPTFSTNSANELVLAAWHGEGSGITDCAPGAGYTLLPNDYCGSSADPSAVFRPVEQQVFTAQQTDTALTAMTVTGMGNLTGAWVVGFKAATVSSDNDLSALTLSAGALTPAFASGTTAYTVSVPNDVASLTVTPTVNQPDATVAVNGIGVTSGSASGSISLNVGANVLTILVTAENSATQAYTVTVNRAAVLPTNVSFGFWPSWLYPHEYEPEWGALTHIAYYWWDINPDGTFSPHYSSVAAEFATAVSQAHTHGVEAIVSVGSSSISDIDAVLATGELREAFATNLLSQVETYGADGINLDLEFPQEINGVTSTPNRSLFEDLMRRIWSKFKAADPDYHVSFCANAALTERPAFNNANLNQYVDAVFPMVYDIRKFDGHGQVTAPNSPYSDISMYVDLVRSASGAETVFGRNKLIYGLPLYGYDWQTDSSNGTDAASKGAHVVSTDAMHIKEVLAYLAAHPETETFRDAASDTPWYRYNAGSVESPVWHQVWYDDAESLRIRYDFIRDLGAQGAGYWALGYEYDYVGGSGGSAYLSSFESAIVPSFSPVAGAYDAAQSVTLSSAQTGATICYTMDGTAPTADGAGTCTHGAVYSGSALTVSSTTTIKAIASQAGYLDSAAVSAVYTINIPLSSDATLSNLVLSTGTLVPSFASGTTAYAVSVANGVASLTVTPTVSEAHASVTVDGTAVASGSASGSISLNVGSNAISVVVTAQDGTTTETYTVTVTRAEASSGSSGGGFTKPTAKAPTFSPAAGSYASAQTVSIASATSGASIYYTLDGTTPSAASSLYASPILIDKSLTVKAIALRTGYANSAVVSAQYVISDTPTAPTEPTTPAAATLLKTPDSFRVYALIDGKKKWIPTPEVFEQLGYQWTRITVVTEQQLGAYPDYEDNLIRAIGDYKVYLVVNGVRRHIPSPDIFLGYGFKWEDVKDVPAETVDKYRAAYLLKQSGVEGIWYIANGVRKLIPTMDIFASYQDKQEDVQVVSRAELESYPVTNLIRLGTSDSVYYLEDGAKRLVPSAAVFAKYRFDWARVVSVNRTEFEYYPTGKDIS